MPCLEYVELFHSGVTHRRSASQVIPGGPEHAIGPDSSLSRFRTGDDLHDLAPGETVQCLLQRVGQPVDNTGKLLRLGVGGVRPRGLRRRQLPGEVGLGASAKVGAGGQGRETAPAGFDGVVRAPPSTMSHHSYDKKFICRPRRSAQATQAFNVNQIVHRRNSAAGIVFRISFKRLYPKSCVSISITRRQISTP